MMRFIRTSPLIMLFIGLLSPIALFAFVGAFGMQVLYGGWIGQLKFWAAFQGAFQSVFLNTGLFWTVFIEKCTAYLPFIAIFSFLMLFDISIRKKLIIYVVFLSAIAALDLIFLFFFHIWFDISKFWLLARHPLTFISFLPDIPQGRNLLIITALLACIAVYIFWLYKKIFLLCRQTAHRLSFRLRSSLLTLLLLFPFTQPRIAEIALGQNPLLAVFRGDSLPKAPGTFFQSAEDTKNTLTDTFEASAQKNAPSRLLVVIYADDVAAAHQSLLGYERPTNAYLQEQTTSRDLLVFNHVVTSQWSFPQALETNFLLGPYEIRHPSNVIAFAKAAGWYTVFLSNHDPDQLLSMARLVDWHFNLQSKSFPYDLPDHRLFRTIQRALSDLSLRKTLFVIYFRGCRRPFNAFVEGKRFQTASAPQRTPQDSLEEARNRYDDCLLALDQLNARMIAALKKNPDRLSTVVITSSRGLDLSLNPAEAIDHRTLSSRTIEVPFYVWSSDAWLKTHGQKWAFGQLHRQDPLVTDVLPFILFDLMDIAVNNVSSFSFSPFSKIFNRRRPRRVGVRFFRDIDVDRDLKTFKDTPEVFP